MESWMQVLFLVGALVLVGPGAYRLIKGNPQFALTSVAGWLGIAMLLAVAYQFFGIGEWWEAKHGDRYNGGSSNQQEQADDPSNNAY